jgi:hypothetical protein
MRCGPFFSGKFTKGHWAISLPLMASNTRALVAGTNVLCRRDIVEIASAFFAHLEFVYTITSGDKSADHDVLTYIHKTAGADIRQFRLRLFDQGRISPLIRPRYHLSSQRESPYMRRIESYENGRLAAVNRRYGRGCNFSLLRIFPIVFCSQHRASGMKFKSGIGQRSSAPASAFSCANAALQISPTP